MRTRAPAVLKAKPACPSHQIDTWPGLTRSARIASARRMRLSPFGGASLIVDNISRRRHYPVDPHSVNGYMMRRHRLRIVTQVVSQTLFHNHPALVEPPQALTQGEGNV